eukprot:scaffold13341_cov119-Skeletonema_dohrnii-CCMP3373.AAC.1
MLFFTASSEEHKHKAQRQLSKQTLLHAFMMMAADGWYIYNGREAVPRHVTRVRIDESLTVIPAYAFDGNPNIEEVNFHVDVKTIEESAFSNCTSLRRVRMRGVKVIGWFAFYKCEALTDVECGKLERIGWNAFLCCKSLGSIDLPSAKIVEGCAFYECTALTKVKFGEELGRIEPSAFRNCTSLEGITIPLKDGMIAADDIFRRCENLKHVDLVGGGRVHEIIDALLLEEWKNDIDEEINAINQIIPTVRAGNGYNDTGEKAKAVQLWIRSVLSKIICYKAQHRSLLNEASTALQHALQNDDIVLKNVLPFLELP